MPNRPPRRALVAGAAVATLLAGTLVLTAALGGGDGPDVVQQASGAAATAPPTEATDEQEQWRRAATEALADWDDFPVDANPRPIILTRTDVGPSGFRTSDQKIAFMAGNWTAPKELPEGPDEAGGYPIMSAREALDRLRSADGGGKAQGTTLEVTDIRLGTVQARTDRGEMKLPAWRVMLTGSIGPNWVPAIAPPARYDDPVSEYYGSGATTREGERALTLAFAGAAPGSGPCGADYAAEIVESDHAVAYRIVKVKRDEPEPTGAVSCTAMAYGREVTVTLDAPIGNRVLLDANSPADVRGPVPVTVQ